MTTRSRRREAGFTLIELMVALVVSAIVVLGVFAFSSIQRSNAAAQERTARIQESLEGAMWAMGQDVRLAGLGISRLCTELRVWDEASGQLVNPSGAGDPALAVVDPHTNEAYWVLRDGLQAHWNSSGAATLDGGLGSSARTGSAADSFDVLLAESNYLGSAGMFVLADALDAADTQLDVRTSIALDSSDAAVVAGVQQLFPPGTFVLVALTPAITALPLSPLVQGQCILLQVTDDVAPGADDDEWIIPIAAGGFNNLAGLLADPGGDECAAAAPPCRDDWDPSAYVAQIATVVPLGRLRWSRYEIDYTVPALPYLVRYDLIGYQPAALGSGPDYPHCSGGACPQPELRLPGTVPGPGAVAIGPMIEDMQIAVGCDGWLPASAVDPMPVPDAGFEELGPAEGPTAAQANFQVDENSPESGQRTVDEWLGNAADEVSAPDCVYYGTGEVEAGQWGVIEPVTPGYRMSPQTMRITLIGSTEIEDAAGGAATTQLLAVEDRAAITSTVGPRQRLALSERFTPDNARWRDPTVR